MEMGRSTNFVGSMPVSSPVDQVDLCATAAGISADRVRELMRGSIGPEDSVVRAIVDLGLADEKALLQELAGLLQCEFLSEEPLEVARELLDRVPASLAVRHHVVPLRMEGGVLYVTCDDPFDVRGWEDFVQHVDCEVRRVLVPRAIIADMLRTWYGLGAETVERILGARQGEESDAVSTGQSDEEMAEEPTVVGLVSKIITEAILSNATDVHFEPYDDRYRVRYRIDGMLQDVSIPSSVHLLKAAVVSRIKIMSGLDITEKRLPHDGRARITVLGREFDLRVSVLPGVCGEAVSIRLQSRQMLTPNLEALGFRPDEQAAIVKIVARPHGLVW